MIIFTFLGKVLVGFSYHYINILSSILYSIIMVNSGGGEGPGEGPGEGQGRGLLGGLPPPSIFASKWGLKGPKKFF